MYAYWVTMQNEVPVVDCSQKSEKTLSSKFKQILPIKKEKNRD